MKTIAQQLNIKQFPFFIKDKNGNELYYEDSDVSWVKRQYDEESNRVYYEDSDGHWVKREIDENGKTTYYENSDGYWSRKQYNEKGTTIYFETSNGKVIDRRPKPEYTMEQLVEKLGEDFKLVK